MTDGPDNGTNIRMPDIRSAIERMRASAGIKASPLIIPPWVVDLDEWDPDEADAHARALGFDGVRTPQPIVVIDDRTAPSPRWWQWRRRRAHRRAQADMVAWFRCWHG